jgi:hypothetical protein
VTAGHPTVLPMSFDLSKTELSPDPRIGACVYLLHGLLQRPEQQQPGLIAGLTECALQDCAAIDPEKSAAAAHGHQIAEEALRMLQLLSDQLTSPREQASRKLSGD